MPKKQKVPQAVKKGLHSLAAKGEIRHPDLARLVAHFFKHAGGEANVAKLLYEEFASADPGSIVRQRILDMILRGVKWSNEKAAPDDEVHGLSDEDLLAELETLIESVAEVEPGGQDRPDPRPAAGPEEARGRAVAADPGLRPAADAGAAAETGASGAD